MKPLKVIEVEGGELAVIFPDDLVSCRGWKIGDEVIATETDRGIVLTVVSGELAHQLGVGGQVMKEQAEVLCDVARRDMGPGKT